MFFIRILAEILTSEQTWTLILIASVIVQFFKVVWVGLLKQNKPTKGHMRIIAFAVSTAVAYFWSGIIFPPLGEDPVVFAIALTAAAGDIFIFAHLAYTVVIDDLLGFLDEKVLGGRKLLAP